MSVTTSAATTFLVRASSVSSRAIFHRSLWRRRYYYKTTSTTSVTTQTFTTIPQWSSSFSSLHLQSLPPITSTGLAYPTQSCFRYKTTSSSSTSIIVANDLKTINKMEDETGTTKTSATNMEETTTATSTNNDNCDNINGNNQNKRSASEEKEEGGRNNNSNNNQNKKQKSGGKNNRAPWGKPRKPSEKERNRAKHSDYDTGVDQRALGPHEGSFANPAMRDMFQVKWTDEDKAKEDAGAISTATTETETKAVVEEGERGGGEGGRDTKKRKVVLLLGFLGTKYGGFQVNMEQRTIQAELELAMFRAGLITSSNFGRPHKYGWSTSARTDKGVHACAHVCSLKVELLPTDVDDEEDDTNTKKNKKKSKKSSSKQPQQGTLESVRQRLQEQLPSDICVLDVLRCTRNFCAHTQRDRVRYSYMIPSFMLHPDWRSVLTKAGIPVTGRDDTAKKPLSDEEVQSLQTMLRGYRSTPEQRASLQTALAAYQGTHSFHSFTRGVKPGQATANRYILEFTVEDPVLVGEDGEGEDQKMEWIPTYVVGQSFLLHQIRKMVSMAVDVARGAAPLSVLTEGALHRNKTMQLSLAPAQGLFLEMSYFMGYNRRKQQQPASRNLPELDWSSTEGDSNNNSTKEEESARTRWRNFRDIIRKHVVEEEQAQGNFLQYLYTQECIFEFEKFYGLEKGNDHYGGDD